jgi:hypothetical protein
MDLLLSMTWVLAKPIILADPIWKKTKNIMYGDILEA